jgi:hypothetical protein
MKANLELMNQLHGLLADYYTEALQGGEELSSGTLTALNGFLKNNNITADLVEKEELMDLGLELRNMINTDNKNKDKVVY